MNENAYSTIDLSVRRSAQTGVQMKEKKKIRISVRNLVEFVLRSGDIDTRRTQGAEKDAMRAGSRIHRKIQKRMGANYRPEVSMKHVVEEKCFQIIVEGRADGVIEKDGAVTIDEIKGVYLDIGRLEEPRPVHLAQAMCYGYFYCKEHQLHAITIQVTYCNLETEDIRRFQEKKSLVKLESWFRGLIREYIKWAGFQYSHEIRRDRSIKQLEFPYPYRRGQRDLAVSVYRTIQRGKTLFIQAPTGIGKTLSTIYPSLKAMGEGYGEKLFYLTAKTITRKVAEEAFDALRKEKLYFSTVTITAKDKLCGMEKPVCNPDACPYAKGHYDRINGAVFEIISKESAITKTEIERYAQKHRVCPFELCLDISNWVDGIICDYNYVFDPDVCLKRYFAEGVSGKYLFLVDEAHNLLPRAREMYSAVLVKEDILLVKRILGKRAGKLVSLLERCNRMMLEMKRECESYQVLPGVNHMTDCLISMFGELETYMEEHAEFEDRDMVLNFYFGVRNFLNILERLDDHYRIYTELMGDGGFHLKLFCIDPSTNLKSCFAHGVSTIFFSATLLPIQYYKELLSGNLQDYAVYADSPFSRKHRLLLIGSDVSSRYTRRNQGEYRKVAEYIRQIALGKKGNYMAFFPSYRYLKEIEARLGEFVGEYEPDITYITQSSQMRETEREAFLEEFNQERETSFVALCVLGGIFSEGIDLKEERLIGAVIVGTGIPMVCPEQEILRDFFEEREKRGFDYAYQYPGMNKVMQAAGRVIRTVQDKGVIVLLDERFLNQEYQELFPREWQEFGIVNRHNVGEWVENFWESI